MKEQIGHLLLLRSKIYGEVEKIAKEQNCLRVTVVTTNDNTKALHFYQKRGFVISVLYKNIMEEERKLKPEIPLTGEDGIPLRDEIELEMILTE